jgi:hypothetical protein
MARAFSASWCEAIAARFSAVVLARSCGVVVGVAGLAGRVR